MEKNKINRRGQKIKKEHVKTIRYVYESRKWREKKHDSVKRFRSENFIQNCSIDRDLENDK